MSRLSLLLCSVALLLAFGVCLSADPARSDSQPPEGSAEPLVVRSEDLQWTERPSGVRVAVLQGDPSAPGPFTLRLQYPAGYRKGPHHHPRDAYVTVLSGRYYRGYGSRFDESRREELTPGTFSVNPGGVNHYEWTTEPALIQVHAVGPWETIYVDDDGRPVDTPR